MKSLKALFNSLMAALVVVTSTIIATPAQGTMDKPPDETVRDVIICVAPGMSEDDQDLVYENIKDLALKLPDGSKVQIFDGQTERRFVSFVVPEARSIRLKYNKLKPDLEKIKTYLSRSRSVREARSNQIDAPRFLSLIGSSMKNGSRETVGLIFGSGYYVTDEAAWSFTPGHVPSPGHPLASRTQSIYGSAGDDSLEGVSLHWATFDSDASTLENTAVSEFWSWVVTERGGVLSSYELYPELVIERLMSGANDPIPAGEIDRTDTALEIRPVGWVPPPPPDPEPAPKQEPKGPPPVPVAEDDSPFVDTSAQTNTPLLFICCDGSGSMAATLSIIRDNIMKLIREGVDICGEVKVSIVVFRGRDNSSILPPTTVRLPITEGGSDEGMDRVIQFLNAKNLRIATGDTERPIEQVSHMHPIGGNVDVEYAIDGMISGVRSTASQNAPVLLIWAGDVDTSEQYGTTDLDPIERDIARRLIDDLGGLMTDYQNAQLVAIFTGTEQHPLYKRTNEEFVEDLAASAGERGVYGTSPVAILYEARDFFRANR